MSSICRPELRLGLPVNRSRRGSVDF